MVDNKKSIIQVAWALFKERGYEATTIDDIVRTANTSKGTFYYYFRGKSTMLETLSVMLDLEYEKLRKEIDPEMNSFDKLIYMNKQTHSALENIVNADLLGALYSTQVTKKEKRSLLDRNRVYYRMVTNIVEEGQRRNQITKEYTVREIVWYYAMCEHGLIYDWCLHDGEYSLGKQSARSMPIMMEYLRMNAEDKP